jgi:hypothetical protein
MPPRHATRGRPPIRAETSPIEANPDRPAENTITQALNRMAEVLQRMLGVNCREDCQPQPEGDKALERFLKFHPPLFQRRSDSEREAEMWMERMEDIFATPNYID